MEGISNRKSSNSRASLNKITVKGISSGIIE